MHTVAEVAALIGRDLGVTLEYLEAYERLGMAREDSGRWWLRASARRALEATAPAAELEGERS
jgi:hypothetical protein